VSASEQMTLALYWNDGRSLRPYDRCFWFFLYLTVGGGWDILGGIEVKNLFLTKKENEE
jgi:hypothetical protein